MPTLVTDSDRVVAAVPSDEGFDLSGDRRSGAGVEERVRGSRGRPAGAVARSEQPRRRRDGRRAPQARPGGCRAAGRSVRPAAAGGARRGSTAVARSSSSSGTPPSTCRSSSSTTRPFPIPPSRCCVPVPATRSAPGRASTAAPRVRATSSARLGFWGLRRVIERRVLDPDLSGAQPLRLGASTVGGRPLLQALDSALVARSARVDGSAAEVLLGALREGGVRLVGGRQLDRVVPGRQRRASTAAVDRHAPRGPDGARTADGDRRRPARARRHLRPVRLLPAARRQRTRARSCCSSGARRHRHRSPTAR